MSIYAQLVDVIRCDPAGRGLACAALLAYYGRAASLARAGKSLAADGQTIGIVTGFPVACGDQIVAETDGPPGALALATVLLALGRHVRLISDSVGMPALAAACKAGSLPSSILAEFPMLPIDPVDSHASADHADRLALAKRWWNDHLAGDSQPRLTHLVAIERPGPTHTRESFLGQSGPGDPPIERFEAALPYPLRDRPLNMRGEPLDAYTAPTHLLFEIAALARPSVKTIGIGDGGNEIGMGVVPWRVLDDVLGGQGAGRIACRIATDELILAGVSNWGGYALAAAVSHAAGRHETFAACRVDRERTILESLVRVAHAVDGVTRRREPTVDGLTLEVHLEVLAQIRELIGLPR